MRLPLAPSAKPAGEQLLNAGTDMRTRKRQIRGEGAMFRYHDAEKSKRTDRLPMGSSLQVIVGLCVLCWGLAVALILAAILAARALL